MVFTTVAIDPASQVANISANPLDAGTDLLRFTARDSEGREASDLVTVDVVNAATSFRLALPAELTVRANRTTSLSLDNFVSSSEFAASEFNWTISTSVGLQALIRDRVAFVAGDADFTGSAELFLTASSPSGEALTGSVAVIVTP